MRCLSAFCLVLSLGFFLGCGDEKTTVKEKTTTKTNGKTTVKEKTTDSTSGKTTVKEKTTDTDSEKTTVKEKTTDKTSDQANPADQKFVTLAAAAGIAEVELGKLARDRASATGVKEFAEHMVTDHTKANKELADLAKKKGFTVPSETDQEHQATATKLENLKGKEFDQAYIKNQVDEHETAVRLFQDQAKNGKDSDLKTLAANTLPTLQDHLKMVRELRDAKTP